LADDDSLRAGYSHIFKLFAKSVEEIAMVPSQQLPAKAGSLYPAPTSGPTQ
jgi:hypothetical protein